MRYTLLTTLSAAVFVLAGCTVATNAYTLTQLAEHDSEADCWMAIDGKIYDVTAYLDTHPAGKEVMLQGCGKDASALYNTKPGSGRDHTEKADQDLATYEVGTLVQ